LGEFRAGAGFAAVVAGDELLAFLGEGVLEDFVEAGAFLRSVRRTGRGADADVVLDGLGDHGSGLGEEGVRSAVSASFWRRPGGSG